MLERPLLYIVSPTYVLESCELDESTSVYERNVPEKISNELIARQLHFFARNKARRVILLLATGERVLGEVMSVQGTDVKIACFEQIRMIHADTIVAIYAAK
ncbi:MAG: 4-diphosphocytidyl-2C-methyl-D-erythritol kinase [Solibacillus sp.]